MKFVTQIFAAMAATAAWCVPATTAQTIVDIAAGDDQFSTLVAAVTKAGLVDTLNDPGASFTVFAPINEAFEAVNVTQLLEDQWSAHLTCILLYHVLATEVLSTDLVEVGQTAETLEGSTVEVTSLDPLQINNGQVVTADIQAENGVVHVIDEVLLPPCATATVVDIAVSLPELFSTLVELLTTAELAEALSQAGPFTVLAPTDEAFALLPRETVDAVTSDLDLLKTVLSYHVIPGIVLAKDLEDGTTATTLAGSDVAVTIDGGSALFNNAEVVSADVLGSNGVVHVINQVLIPPDAASDEEPETEVPETEAPSPAQEEGQSIVEIAVGDENFSTLVAALTAAGLVETLEGDGPFTVFAPVDDAFEVVDVEKLLQDEWRAHLQSLLLYHVVEGKIMSTDLSLDLAATTVEGSDVTVTSYPDPVMINDATVVQADIEATNGVIHVIDEVLLPPSATSSIVDIAVGDDMFSTLVELLGMANLVEALQEDGPFTVFAPTNDAFAKLPQATVDALTSDITALTDVLLYHVVPGIILSSDLTDGAMVETLQGTDVTASLDPTMINDANVVAADILAKNGVIHVIDTVLVPSAEGGPPTPAPAPAGGFSRLVSVDYDGAGNACIEVDGGVAAAGQKLILGDCTGGGWRFSNGMLYSELDDNLCMQVGYGSYESDEPLEYRYVRLGSCDSENHLQQWVWEAGEGLRPVENEQLCVLWQGETPNVGSDYMLLLFCEHWEDKIDWNLE